MQITNGRIGIYVGSLREGKANGTGKLTCTMKGEFRGHFYHGECKDDILHGQGTKYDTDGIVRSKGEFKDGVLHGQCAEYYGSGNVLYEGQYKDG